MDIRQLECFIAVAEELHFRKASELLGLSQSALSERVSSLEHELGARLFFRTTRQVSLTQAGSEFAQDAKRILTDIDKSVSNVRHTAESDLHHIRVSGVDEAISMLLPQVLLTFRQTDFKVHVQVLEISSSEQHSHELIAHRTDVAFVRTRLEDDFISSELLHRQPIVVVLAETNPLSRSVSLSIADIADQPIVGYPKHARPILHEALWSILRSNLQTIQENIKQPGLPSPIPEIPLWLMQALMFNTTNIMPPEPNKRILAGNLGKEK